MLFMKGGEFNDWKNERLFYDSHCNAQLGRFGAWIFACIAYSHTSKLVARSSPNSGRSGLGHDA